jgi:hypothetical protein
LHARSRQTRQVGRATLVARGIVTVWIACMQSTHPPPAVAGCPPSFACGSRLRVALLCVARYGGRSKVGGQVAGLPRRSGSAAKPGCPPSFRPSQPKRPLRRSRLACGSRLRVALLCVARYAGRRRARCGGRSKVGGQVAALPFPIDLSRTPGAHLWRPSILTARRRICARKTVTWTPLKIRKPLGPEEIKNLGKSKTPLLGAPQVRAQKRRHPPCPGKRPGDGSWF